MRILKAAGVGLVFALVVVAGSYVFPAISDDGWEPDRFDAAWFAGVGAAWGYYLGKWAER